MRESAGEARAWRAVGWSLGGLSVYHILRRRPRGTGVGIGSRDSIRVPRFTFHDSRSAVRESRFAGLGSRPAGGAFAGRNMCGRRDVAALARVSVWRGLRSCGLRLRVAV